MKASRIRPGKEYAVNDSPRKGVPESDFYTLRAQRVRVIEMKQSRWADNANEGCGAYLNDGISVALLNSVGIDQGHMVFKARDFLMPWSDYAMAKEEHRAATVEREEQRRAIVDRFEQRQSTIYARLLAMGLSSSDVIKAPVHQFPDEDDISVRLSFKGVERLLGSISEQVYEMLRDAE